MRPGKKVRTGTDECVTGIKIACLHHYRTTDDFSNRKLETDPEKMKASGRAILIKNLGSRHGQGMDIAAGLDILRAHGMQIDTRMIGGKKIDLTPAQLKKYDLVIVGGGDGTLNVLAELLVESGLPLGILPLGTGNDLARSLNIPFQVEAACRVIVAGNRKRINLGRVNGKYFFNVASIGISTKLTRKLDPEAKKKWGRLSYMRALSGIVLENQTFKAKIVAGGTETFKLRTLQIAVGNGRFYGGGIVFAENSTIESRELGLYTINTRNFLELLKMAPSFVSGRHIGLEQVTFLHAEKFEVHTSHPLDIDTDGELTGRTPAYFDMHIDALEVFVPVEAANSSEQEEEQ